MLPKELYAEMGWEKTAYSRKYRGKMKIEDDEVIALRRILRAPAPWPFVSLEDAAILAAFRGRTGEVFQHLGEILKLLDEKKKSGR